MKDCGQRYLVQRELTIDKLDFLHQKLQIQFELSNVYLNSVYLLLFFNSQKMIQLHDKSFAPFISAKEIDLAITKIVQQIKTDLGDEIPVFLGVLNGSFMFVSDFMKQFSGQCELSFVKLASYDGITSTEEVQHLIGLHHDLTNRTVIVLEDIVDTGTTLLSLKKSIEKESVKSFKVASLFFKPEAYKKEITIDYVGIRIPDKFIVGYGLDYNGLGRNLPAVYQLKE